MNVELERQFSASLYAWLLKPNVTHSVDHSHRLRKSEIAVL